MIKSGFSVTEFIKSMLCNCIKSGYVETWPT